MRTDHKHGKKRLPLRYNEKSVIRLFKCIDQENVTMWLHSLLFIFMTTLNSIIWLYIIIHDFLDVLTLFLAVKYFYLIFFFNVQDTIKTKFSSIFFSMPPSIFCSDTKFGFSNGNTPFLLRYFNGGNFSVNFDVRK